MDGRMFKTRFLVLYSLLSALLVACAPAGGQLQVSDVWARPGLAGGNSAVYFVITNDTGGTDSLRSASSDVAGAVELHMTTMEDGNMQMEQQQEVPVEAGKTEFQPGGLHVMLIGLNKDLNPGDTFSITLDFATAGVLPLDVTVIEP
jgi:periplasmic copper chaperone A